MSRPLEQTLCVALISTFVLVCCCDCFYCDLEQLFNGKEVSVEESVATSQVVFKGFTTTSTATPLAFTAYFQLITTYKGAKLLEGWGVDNYRRVNVTFLTRPSSSECAEGINQVPREYIIFCNLVNDELRATSVAKWDESADQRVWTALGWSKWSDWSSCSVSCSSGIQQRIRYCRLDSCPGFNVEQRHCNLFGCSNCANPLDLAESRFFHPSKDSWQRDPNRPTAFRLKPNSYIWVPTTQLFPGSEAHPFPKEFALFVTLRLGNETSIGTVFSLRSRRRQDTYLSLEVAGRDLKLIHAAANGTDVVRIPAQLDNGQWHHIALSIRDDSVVDSYVDCEWSRTDILRSHTLDIPDDSDLIIGYLFTGDLEQLTIVPDPRVVSLQCSPQRTPIIDPTVKGYSSQDNTNKATHVKPRKFKKVIRQ